MKTVNMLAAMFIFFLFWGCGSITSPEEARAPYNAKLIKTSENVVLLTWQHNKSLSDTVSYHIARKAGISDWIEDYNTTNNKNFQDYISTSDSLVYSYKVKAEYRNRQFFSAYSDVVAYFSSNAVMKNLKIEKISYTNYKVKWQNPVKGHDGIRVDKKLNSGNWINGYKDLPPNSTSFLDEADLLTNVAYRLTAYSGKTNGQSAEISTFIALPPPMDLSLSLIHADRVQLRWLHGSSFTDYYTIDRKVGEQDWQIDYATVTYPDSVFIDDINLQSATLTYRVKAVDGTNLSDYTEEQAVNVRLNEVGYYETEGPTSEIALVNWQGFLANLYEGFVHVDCSNPSAPEKVEMNIVIADRVKTVGASGNYVFVGSHSSGEYNGKLTRVDTRSLGQSSISQVTTHGIPNKIFIGERYGYLADGPGGLTIFDLNTGGLLGNCSVNGEALSVFVEGTRAYLALGNNGVAIVNVDNSNSPSLLANLYNLGYCADIQVKNGLLYLAGGINGLVIATDTGTILSQKSTGNYARSLIIDEMYCFVADYNNTFSAIDCTNPAIPVITGGINLEGRPEYINLYASYAFVSHAMGVSIIRIKP